MQERPPMKPDPSSGEKPRDLRPPMKLYVGDVLELKKPHPCGANEWEITKLGMDVRLRCRRCGRCTMILRSRLERRIRRFLERPAEVQGQEKPE
ncbi:MAG: DUF951 domain-containing protein [Armatimonadetes bacterium]|nr:DUF951 domain-containing protein [Armatimonadota bacterium]